MYINREIELLHTWIKNLSKIKPLQDSKTDGLLLSFIVGLLRTT
jgi:hypothetical protein